MTKLAIRAVLPMALLVPAVALLSGGCASTSPSDPTPTNTAVPGTAIVAGRVVRAGTPASGVTVRLWNNAGGTEFSGSPQSTDSNGNFSFNGVPINTSPNDTWFVKWVSTGPIEPPPAGSPTVDWTEFGLVQTRAFSVSSSGSTYTTPNMDLASQGFTLTTPANDTTVAVSSNPNFTWSAPTVWPGYGWRIDSSAMFGSPGNICSYPTSNFTPGMANAMLGTACSIITPSGSVRYWRCACTQATSNGIEVVSSTKYRRITLN